MRYEISHFQLFFMIHFLILFFKLTFPFYKIHITAYQLDATFGRIIKYAKSRFLRCLQECELKYHLSGSSVEKHFSQNSASFHCGPFETPQRSVKIKI